MIVDETHWSRWPTHTCFSLFPGFPAKDIVLETVGISFSSLPPSWRLDGRVAFVTGAGGAIGGAVCRALSEAGARVVCADLSPEAAQATARAVDGEPAVLDVCDRKAFDAAVHDAAGRLGRLDVMCNIAGIPGRSQRVAELEEEAFDQMFAVHFKGVLYGCQAALRCMLPAGRGAIVNMSSEAIDIAPATIASYSVSKAAVSMLSKVLAAEVGPRGVRVNTVAPSFIPSALSLRRYQDDEQGRQRYLDGWAAKSPLGTLCSADDVAMQVLYLASDAAGFVSGQTMRANGGISMPW
jgi:3-oxoacyl-[acyl-carrier protein] reductase